MNKILNPCVKTFRTFHRKLFATTISFQSEFCAHLRTLSRQGKQSSYSLSHYGMNNGRTDFLCTNNGHNYIVNLIPWKSRHTRNLRTNSGLKKDRGDEPANDGRSKEKVKIKKFNHNSLAAHQSPAKTELPNILSTKTEKVNLSLVKTEQANVISAKTEQDNQESPEIKPHYETSESKTPHRNPSPIIANAHEEFYDIQRKNASMSEDGTNEKFKDKTYNAGRSTDKQRPANPDDSQESITAGSKGRRMKVGLQYETEITFSYDDLLSFGKLSRDWNPIHYYPDDGRVQHLSKIFSIQSLEEIEAKKKLLKEAAIKNSSNLDAQSNGRNISSVVNQVQDSADTIRGESTADNEELSPHVPILPGALMNNLISGIMGTKLPGPGTLILHQTLNYKNMAFVDEKIHFRVRITAVRKMLVTATYKVWTYRGADRVIILTGDARLVCRF